jgi:hypothetical protein
MTRLSDQNSLKNQVGDFTQSRGFSASENERLLQIRIQKCAFLFINEHSCSWMSVATALPDRGYRAGKLGCDACPRAFGWAATGTQKVGLSRNFRTVMTRLNARRMADVNDRLRPTGPIRDNNGRLGFSSRHTRI